MDIYKFPLQELMLRFPTICFPAAYSLVALLAAVTSPPDFRCENNDFVCENGIQCIPEEKVCDGQEDCTDGSDEADHNCCKELIAIYRRFANGVHFSEIWEIQHSSIPCLLDMYCISRYRTNTEQCLHFLTRSSHTCEESLLWSTNWITPWHKYSILQITAVKN